MAELIRALRSNDIGAVRRLLHEGHSPNQHVDDDLVNILFVSFKSMRKFSFFIKHGTSLHVAAENDERNEILKLFIASKIDVECRSQRDDWIALHMACCRKAAKNVTTLLANGALICAKNDDGSMPKHLAFKLFCFLQFEGKINQSSANQ